MAEVIGPCSTLPGAGHELPAGTMCDLHPDRPAARRVQGETDSFGAELNDLCEGCMKARLEYSRRPEARSGQCDWCRSQASDLRNTRDFEEGLSGRVYRVCGGCIAKQHAEINEELDRWDDQYGDLWGDE